MSIMQLTGSSSQKQIVPKDHGMHIWMPPSLLGIALETPTLPRVQQHIRASTTVETPSWETFKKFAIQNSLN